MGIWKGGETYLVKITNPAFCNFDKIIKVKYCFYDENANAFFPADEEYDNGEAYTDEDFELIDETPVEKYAETWIKTTYGDVNQDIRDKLIKAYKAGYFKL